MSSTAGRSSVPELNWSPELEEIHQEDSRDHFIDVRTRTAVIDAVGTLPPRATVLEIGCSSGYLLKDLRDCYPYARLAGIDAIPVGLHNAARLVPGALLALGEATQIPVASGSADLVVGVNVLEHIADDVATLSEIRRVLRPDGRAALVVPAGSHLFDYYDLFLRHQRRYNRADLTSKAERAGLHVICERFLGTLIYPPFWILKKYHRVRYRNLTGAALTNKVASDIAATKNSPLGRLACNAEQLLENHGLHLPFGIRLLLVVSPN